METMHFVTTESEPQKFATPAKLDVPKRGDILPERC